MPTPTLVLMLIEELYTLCRLFSQEAIAGLSISSRIY